MWNPHLNQKKIRASKARFKVIVCGRRFGKTTYAIKNLVRQALANRKSNYFYIAPTYRQAKMIAWSMLVDTLQKIPQEWVTKVNESELYCIIGNGSRIDIKGADNPDSLRGVGLNGVVLDEYADMKRNVFDEIIRPALTDKKGWADFIGTPRGFNHFYDLYIEADDKDEWDKFHFTTYDNPYLEKEEIESAKKELSEDKFAQEYLADFRKHEGVIYKEFSRDVHVIEPFKIPVGWYRGGGMDFGATNPTVLLWIAVDRDDRIYIYDEYYAAEQSTEFHSNVIKTKIGAIPLDTIWGDPSGKQEIIDYANFKLYVTPAVKVIPTGEQSWVNAGIDRVKRLLKIKQVDGKPKLFVFKNCVNTIKEFETYQWMEQVSTKHDNINEKDQPLKAGDHCMDALRMFVISHFASKDI